MTTPLQPGTLVEVVHAPGYYPPAGTRAWVEGTLPPRLLTCPVCGDVEMAGLLLTIPPISPTAVAWCPNHWKPVGGDFEEAKRTVGAKEDA